ncbi:GNAT family N-acetyltransferase [Flavobacteriales bacterium 34_180_T64]|nr:GNAT family N-acetyltransferase [Flavobacteriales bacterium 34_180_T64]
MIRKGTLTDIDRILDITKACAVFMTSNSIFQWNEHYPNREPFEIDVQREELYVQEINSKVIGCIVLSKIKDEEYNPIPWLTPDGKNIYIHRLAIHPNQQGKGQARLLMDFAETFARNNHFDSIRLDTFSQNLRNQKFYELRGYKRLGEIYFPKQSEHPFYCYELIL